MDQSALKADMALSALRGLATTGHFTSEQLSAMENALYGKKDTSLVDKQWLDMDEASKHSKLCKSTLWQHVRLGHLAIHKIGRRSLIEHSELDAFLLKDQAPAWPKRKRRLFLGNLKQHGN